MAFSLLRSVYRSLFRQPLSKPDFNVLIERLYCLTYKLFYLPPIRQGCTVAHVDVQVNSNSIDIGRSSVWFIDNVRKG